MKLIWHLIRKDIARERWGLAVWALLFVAQDLVGVYARLATGAQGDWVTALQLANAGLVFLQAVMAYVLVARWVQADALVGSNQFWPTRPISAARLFAAKAAGVLLIFALLPVLLLLPWWLYCRFGWHDILWTAVDTIGWQLLAIAPAFLVASLTDDLGRVLLWTLLLVVGLLSWLVLFVAFSTSALGRDAGHAGAALMFSRIWLSALMIVIGGFLIGAHQYLTRGFGRSVVLVVLCLGMVAMVSQIWRVNLAQFIGAWHEPALPPSIPALSGGLKFTILPSRGTFGPRDAKHGNDASARDASLNLGLQIDGLPDEMEVAAESKPLTWTWRDGMRLTREAGLHIYERQRDPTDTELRRIYSLPTPPQDQETVQWRKTERERIDAKWRANGWKPPVWRDPFMPVPPGLRLGGYLRLPNSYLAKMRAEPPAFSANLHVFLYRPEVILELPLQPEALASGHARTLHLRQLNQDKPLLVVITRPAVAAAGLWFSGLMRGEFRNWLYRDRFVAVNHATGDIGWVGENQAGSQMLQVAGVIVNWNNIYIGPGKVIRHGKWVVADPQWGEHTTLVLLTDKEAARFNREVKNDRFELEPERAP